MMYHLHDNRPSSFWQTVLAILQYGLGVVTALLLVATILFMLTSCHKDLLRQDLSDVREVCVSYTVPDGREFPSSIATMRWLVYDAQGHYFCELQMEPKQRQYFEPSQLPDGQYTAVNVANATNRTLFENTETLNDLALYANTR